VAATARPTTRRATTIAILAALVGSQLAMVGLLVMLGGSGECPAPGPTPTAQARNSIPASALAVYQQAGRRHNIDWAFLASIGAQECDQDVARARV
jgi:hypothetical protein